MPFSLPDAINPKYLNKLSFDIKPYDNEIFYTLTNKYNVAPEVFEEMEQIKKEAIEWWYFLQAPNWKPSNLNEKLWLLVRTKNFKKWFWDCEQTTRFSSPGFEMLIWIPGSGKSTYLKTLNNSNISIVSPDNIRKELTGNISDQSKDMDVWAEVEKRINELLSQWKYVILDATNVTTEYRIPLLNRIKDNNNGINSYATLFDIDPEESKKRIKEDIENKIDRSNVPDNIIDMMFDLYQETLKSLPAEGFTGIYNKNDINSISKVVDENWEPKIMYHWTNRRHISEFRINTQKRNGMKDWVYFTSYKKKAREYTLNWMIYECFLNIKNPLIIDFEWKAWSNFSFQDTPRLFNKTEEEIKRIQKPYYKTSDIEDIVNTLKSFVWKFERDDIKWNYAIDQIVKIARHLWYDWIIAKNVKDIWKIPSLSRKTRNLLHDQVIVLDSNQIKDTNNVWTFSENINNIKE